MKNIIQFYFTIITAISPKLAAKSAFNVFQKVRLKKIRDREKPFYEEAKHFKIDFESEPLDCYELGNPEGDIIILIHGWDSNAGALYQFVNKLDKSKNRIISFNLPGHAFHKASKTNLFICKNAFKTLLNTLPTDKKISIVSHSFGSAITGYALSEVDREVDQLIFLTSPNGIENVFIEFKAMIGLKNKPYNLLKSKAAEILNESLDQLMIHKKLALANFNHLYLLHDKNDKVISFQNSIDINQSISNSTLLPYENIGHYRMLWNDDLVDTVTNLIES